MTSPTDTPLALQRNKNCRGEAVAIPQSGSTPVRVRLRIAPAKNMARTTTPEFCKARAVGRRCGTHNGGGFELNYFSSYTIDLLCTLSSRRQIRSLVAR